MLVLCHILHFLNNLFDITLRFISCYLINDWYITILIDVCYMIIVDVLRIMHNSMWFQSLFTILFVSLRIYVNTICNYLNIAIIDQYLRIYYM